MGTHELMKHRLELMRQAMQSKWVDLDIVPGNDGDGRDRSA